MYNKCFSDDQFSDDPELNSYIDEMMSMFEELSDEVWYGYTYDLCLHLFAALSFFCDCSLCCCISVQERAIHLHKRSSQDRIWHSRKEQWEARRYFKIKYIVQIIFSFLCSHAISSIYVLYLIEDIRSYCMIIAIVRRRSSSSVRPISDIISSSHSSSISLISRFGRSNLYVIS